MLSPPLQTALEQSLQQALGSSVVVQKAATVGGGCINRCYSLTTTQGPFFAKMNSESLYPGMFAAEAKGLQLLKEVGAIHVPQVVTTGHCKDEAYLVLEHISSGAQAHSFWQKFGQQLAMMHRQTATHFGLDHDNYIGSLPQHNQLTLDWPTFFIEQRLQPQLRMATGNNAIDKATFGLIERMFPKISELFPEEPPALLHGDLWSGNYMTSASGGPCIIDPAVYYGHREMDIGMTKLFSGFPGEFYAAYNTTYPLQDGWEARIEIANIYPLLVHVNLFGGGYLSQVKSILNRYL